MSKNCSLLQTSASVSFEWPIKEFFPLPDMTGNRLESPSFQLSDAKWIFQFFPNGINGTSVWIPLYLSKESSSCEKYNIEFTLGIRNSDGSELTSFKERHTFAKNYECWLHFIERAPLLRSKDDIVPENGSLTLFCTIRDTTTHMICENAVHTSTQTCSQKSIDILQKNFTDLYTSGREKDVTFKVEDEELKAHRLILSARSPVFLGMFNHDTEDKRTGVVNIVDCDAETFSNFLTFIYSGNSDVVSSSNSIGLYKMADKYDLKDLKNKCLRNMSENLSLESFCDVLLLAELYNESELLQSATDFFAKNMAFILRSSDWQLLGNEHFTIANELYGRVAKML